VPQANNYVFSEDVGEDVDEDVDDDDLFGDKLFGFDEAKEGHEAPTNSTAATTAADPAQPPAANQVVATNGVQAVVTGGSRPASRTASRTANTNRPGGIRRLRRPQTPCLRPSPRPVGGRQYPEHRMTPVGPDTPLGRALNPANWPAMKRARDNHQGSLE
jgi:hypothetical protein